MGAILNTRVHAVSVFDNDREFAYTRTDFERVRERIYRIAGISLSDAKADLVYSRLARRLRATGLQRFDDYLAELENSPDEQREFINALTTNLTSFFREPHHFDTLKAFLKKRSTPIRIWCGAASTGEEPYSLAMTAIEAFGSMQPPVRILATDLDTQVLHTASNGIYPADRVERLTEARLQRFFLRGKGSKLGMVRVHPALQALLDFRQLNLLARQWPMKQKFDAIFLRNVLIYFDKPTQADVLYRCADVLQPDGLLFVGHSESLTHVADRFQSLGKTVYCLQGSRGHT